MQSETVMVGEIMGVEREKEGRERERGREREYFASLLPLFLFLSLFLHFGRHLIDRMVRQSRTELPENVMDQRGLFNLL